MGFFKNIKKSILIELQLIRLITSGWSGTNTMYLLDENECWQKKQHFDKQELNIYGACFDTIC